MSCHVDANIRSRTAGHVLTRWATFSFARLHGTVLRIAHRFLHPQRDFRHIHDFSCHFLDAYRTMSPYNMIAASIQPAGRRHQPLSCRRVEEDSRVARVWTRISALADKVR